MKIGNEWVIGYDPINEPMASDIYEEPSLVFIPGKFDHKMLQPMYERHFETT